MDFPETSMSKADEGSGGADRRPVDGEKFGDPVTPQNLDQFLSQETQKIEELEKRISNEDSAIATFNLLFDDLQGSCQLLFPF